MEENVQKEKIAAMLERIKSLQKSPYKSTTRAIKRGHITLDGLVAPKRPFNNRKNTSDRGKDSRETNTFKKEMYEKIKQRLLKQQVQ